MNYNKNEADDLKIKAHLDASLDIKGISVSEELINRTLAAIKENSAEAEISRDKDAVKIKRLPSWSRYIYGFAKVAAVVLIIAAGYVMLRNYPAKKDSNNLNMDMRATGSKSEDQMAYEFAAGSADSGSSKTADSADDGMLNGSYGLTSFNSEEAKEYDADRQEKISLTMQLAPQADVSIQDVIFTEPEQIQSLTVREGDGAAVVLTGKDEIKEFCEVLARYQYTSVGVDGDSGSSDYVIVVSKQDETEYTIFVGSRVVMEYMEDESLRQQVYELENMDLLLTDLQELYNKYK